METLMAWNEPGNNGKDRDPWGNNGKNQGPPDLDEMLRKVSRRFGGLLGGGKSGGGDVGKFGLSIALVAMVADRMIRGWYARQQAAAAPHE